MVCNQLPYETEQGIFKAVQGKLFLNPGPEQGFRIFPRDSFDFESEKSLSQLSLERRVEDGTLTLPLALGLCGSLQVVGQTTCRPAPRDA